MSPQPREIRFKAYHIASKIMYWFDILWGNFKQGGGYIGMVEWGKQRDHGFAHDGNQVLVDPNDCELMQFTGLLDKNGKEIYEGDVMEWRSKFRDTEIETPPKKGRVEYEKQACAFWIKYEWENPDGKIIHSYKELTATGGGDYYINDTIEIIGNIYQNEDLLK